MVKGHAARFQLAKHLDRRIGPFRLKFRRIDQSKQDLGRFGSAKGLRDPIKAGQLRKGIPEMFHCLEFPTGESALSRPAELAQQIGKVFSPCSRKLPGGLLLISGKGVEQREGARDRKRKFVSQAGEHFYKP